MRLFWTLPLLLLSLSGCDRALASLFREGRGAVLVYSGDAGVTLERNGVRKTVVAGELLQLHDRIATRFGGVADLNIEGFALLKLDEGSEVEIVALDNEEAQFRLLRGNLLSIVRKADPRSTFSILSPGVRTTVRGTIFLVHAGEGGVAMQQSEIGVLSGAVSVRGNNGELYLESGQMLPVSNGSLSAQRVGVVGRSSLATMERLSQFHSSSEPSYRKVAEEFLHRYPELRVIQNSRKDSAVSATGREEAGVSANSALPSVERFEPSLEPPPEFEHTYSNR